MLLQRLRTAEPTVEAAIAYNLVDLALEAPEAAFADIIKVFSQINRSANPDDPRFSNNMVSIDLCSVAQRIYCPGSIYRFSRHKRGSHANCVGDPSCTSCTSLSF